MKLVVGGFLSVVVDGAVSKVSACLENNYNMPERVKELLRELETKFTMVKAICEAADNCLTTNTSLVQWLRLLHTTTQEAEDALDEFQVEEASITGKRKVSELIVSSLRSLKNLVIPDRDVIRLEQVVKTITQLCATSNTFLELLKLDDYKANQQQAGVAGETTSQFPIDVQVFGREEITEFILQMIIESSSHDHERSSGGTGKTKATRDNIIVLPIVGMSGVGKTTLAQVVYNHAEVKRHFQRRAWVYVSEHFSFKRTLQEILFSINGYEGNGLDSCDSMEATITKLRSKICGGYKFFLVLDNVWEEICQEWSTLLTVLSDEARQHGSVLLVTTQNQKVAQTIAILHPIELKALPWKSFWPLFQYYAFGGTEVAQQKDNHNMLSIGREIAMKLDGLPLAAKVIGNLLRCRFSEANWRRVVDSDWWNLSDALQEILPYLRVSYQHLSPQERQCFAFCSIFPRNYLFDKERIVQMWIAHDFIQRNKISDGIKPEDVGRQCFDALMDRSLFQATIVNNKYVMHDLVRCLAIAVSVDQCFLDDERAGGTSSLALENVRHLSLQTGSLEQCRERQKYKNLRTLLLFGRFESDAFFPLLDGMLRNSPRLRVLDLSYVEAPGSGWPDNAMSLRKLRFLDMSFTRITKFKDLPVNLQVLHLRGYDAGSLPRNITKLSNLRHLFVDNSALSNIPGIGQLTELQGLDSFIARKGQGFTIRELKNMRELTGQLCIRGLENVRSKEETMEARMIDKKHLCSLVIEGRKVSKFVLEGLQPHPNIQELTIKFYQDQNFPHWVLQLDNLANLVHVNLENCRSLSTLPPLGHLPLLKLFSLRKLQSLKHIDGTSFGGFPSLEELEFHWLEKWEDWTEPEEATVAAHVYGSPLFLGCLKKLHLVNCFSLRQFPRLPHLSALKELKISNPGNYILELPNCLQVLACLTTLSIEYCQHSIVLSPHQLKSLENLELMRCEGLRLADGFQCFCKLRSARVEGCPQLLSDTASSVSANLGQNLHEKQQQQGANLLTHLRTDDSLMNGDYFRMMGNLSSLRNLTMFNVPNTTHFLDEQDQWFQHLTSLEVLVIDYSIMLQHIPSSLAVLPSIKELILNSLHNLHSLPDALPPKLQKLVIVHCNPDLHIRVSKDGSDWPKVVHVPYILVDGTVVQNI
ncbi:hypothetical protein HU200_053001 [Digitaria exilis]|uniref:Uncharacterized protein n=1 Tax=Digitaria exilis TaxID=1010633 RepID=A0A835E6S4_9POAL|nr:hypothetical protein HU200_053001 [Digitaria exilis]